MSRKGFCPSCGTRILSYPQETIRVINKALTGKTITISSYTEEWTYVRDKSWTIGPDAKYLRDACFDNVLQYTSARQMLSRESVRITNQFSVDPEFRRSRTDFDRIELIVSNDGEYGSFHSKGKNPRCPVCGGTTIEREFYTGVLFREIEEKKFIVTEIEKCKSDAEEFISNIKQECVAPRPSSSQITVEIKKYLDTLIDVESEIYYFTNRLESLLVAQIDTGRKALKERCYALQRAKEAIEVDLKAAKNEKANLEKKYLLLPLTITPEEFGLCEPVAPELKSAGWFNKKRIEEENRQAKEQFEQALSKFRSAWKQIQHDELTRRTVENNLISENRRMEEARLNAHIDELTQQAASVTADVTGSGIQKANDFCLAEIEEVKEKIRSLCDVRAQLVGLGVIYPKYLDFIALTTIAEYFDAGRCSALEGPDGAYNLYESEIRANRVIAQLDQVIASLDTIKQNQYRAYSVLSQISRDTASISDKMISAVKSLSEISQNTAAIKETNELIAYNTEKTAYYSKVNAELTGALGYLIAFK